MRTAARGGTRGAVALVPWSDNATRTAARGVRGGLTPIYGVSATRIGGAGRACGINLDVERQQRDRALGRLASRQHGVVSRAQMIRLGFEVGAIDRRLDAGRLRRLHRGVYLLGPVAPPLAAEMAAILSCGRGSVLSHRSAAHLWNLLPHMPKPTMVEVTTSGRDPGTRPRIRIHRVRNLDPTETTITDRIPITTPARTLLDIAINLQSGDLEQALAAALRRRLTTRQQLHSLLARHRRQPGTLALRSLLQTDRRANFTRSEAERRFLALIRHAELPPPEVNVRLHGHEVDFLWREQRLVVEVDGYAFHSDRPSFEHDHRRDADLVAHGYRVIRVTWRQIADAPMALAARVAVLLVSPRDP